MIHYFGLGFIQLKLGGRKRLHFYNLTLPKIMPEEEAHNHRYHFRSTIILGNLTNTICRPTLGTSHYRTKVSCDPKKTVNDDTLELCNLEFDSEHIYTAGSVYVLHHNTFHKVRSNYCITLIERRPTIKEFAEVIRERGTEPVCPFSMSLSESYLWEMVEEMIEGVSHQRLNGVFSG